MDKKPVVFQSGAVFLAFVMIVLGGTIVCGSLLTELIGKHALLVGAMLAFGAIFVQPGAVLVDRLLKWCRWVRT